jgi:hypothetical protein
MDVSDATERTLVALRPNREATFADAAAEWRDWAEHTRRLKPASLRSCDAMLALPGLRPRNGGPRVARIMRAFGDRPIASITTAEIERFLRRLDRESRVPTAKRDRRGAGASLSVGNLVRTDRRDPEWWLARPEGSPQGRLPQGCRAGRSRRAGGDAPSAQRDAP